MKRPEPESLAAELRSQAAADWLVRRDHGLTAGEQDEFLHWLAADPRHGEWFALHRQTVGDFSALANWRPEHSEEPNPDLLAPRRRQIYWLKPALLAAAAAVAIGAVWWREKPAITPAPIANIELKRRILEDGSSIELNHRADVTTSFSATERRVTLVRGEALFSVKKDPLRPFIVHVGGVDVRAVGTVFSVRLEQAAVEVLVTEGKVGVQRALDAVGQPSTQSPLVSAGQRATVSLTNKEPPQIVAVSAPEMAQLLNWQPQLLDFSSAPLSVAVAEFNRRNRVQFVLADAELAALPIVATIRSDNVEGFAAFLAAGSGIQIEHRGATEIVVRRKR